LALYYNSLGQLVARRTVDPQLVVGTTGYRTRQAWGILEPYINRERATGNTSYMSHFEHLARLAFAVDANRRHFRPGVNRLAPAMQPHRGRFGIILFSKVKMSLIRLLHRPSQSGPTRERGISD
jgi:hypothetical protein